jgi:hypothetical protein
MNQEPNMANEIRRFSAPWSILNWCLTIVVSLIVFIVLPYGILREFLTGNLTSDPAKAYAFLFGLIPAIFVLAVFFAPMRYTISSSEVIINRLGPNIVIPINSIDNIKRLQRKDVGFLPMRLFGVGGFFGSYGTFWSFRLGLFQGYVTNTRTLVFITYDKNMKVLISPERPDDFLDDVTQLQN